VGETVKPPGAGDEGESKSRVLLQALCLVDRKVKVRNLAKSVDFSMKNKDNMDNKRNVLGQTQD
jgi:hypothetical protein